ncbi:gamma-aminobutyrate transaminase POP2 [Cucumis melo var. makuwa]|uniref:Gamma-aminobutyrate transaminase POP2 n=1 Tax=Cucumis melo var. makuwa TaxID=1194695 RepID=A0A5D3CPT8_CUCMM|nr:gamma-aminobutyrate transaminase POP2 [Cucumis melo var. makuwa]
MWRGSVQDDVLRHPADVEGWKHFSSEFLDFTSDPRNVRLDLASDGFNPFGEMSTSYSMWKIDVYLQPLIEELKKLWTFEEHTYDSLTGHRCYLLYNHVWRRSRLRNGKIERVALSMVMNGQENLEQLDQLEFPVMKIIVSHRVDDHIEDDTLCRNDIDPTIVESIMSLSYPRNNFLETDAMFHKFENDLDKLTRGSSSAGDNSGSFSQPPITSTPRRCAQS